MADGSALRERYGTPVRLADREDNVVVFQHVSEESARAFAAANNADELQPVSWVEKCGSDWITVVDFRIAIANHEKLLSEEGVLRG